MLELRPTCEQCNKTPPPASLEARIGSYECTFCATCVEPAGQSAMRPRCDMVQTRCLYRVMPQEEEVVVEDEEFPRWLRLLLLAPAAS
jgi:hypothetical protein